jgi:DNA-binding CsgD family transcriptional regulator
MQVYTRDLIDKAIEGRVLESPFVNEALFPNRMQFWQGVYASGPGNSDAILWVSHRKRHLAPFGDTAVDMLNVLQPAFQAGLSAVYRLDAARSAFEGAGAPAIVFGADGVELHRTRAFQDILAHDSAGGELVAAARALATRARGALLRVATLDDTAGAHTSVVTTPADEYALRATLVPEGAFSSTPGVLILVRPASRARPPAASELQEKFGLTAREAEVALLIARGATRKEIAGALGISEHTARAHTERVFQKLSVTTRAAVGPALLGAKVRP